MHSRSTKMSSFSIVFLIFVVTFLSTTHFVDGAATRNRCTDDELDEAQKAFRNCVDSAKAGIVARHGAQADNGEAEEDVKAVEEDRRDGDVAPTLCDELVRDQQTSAHGRPIIHFEIDYEIQPPLRIIIF